MTTPYATDGQKVAINLDTDPADLRLMGLAELAQREAEALADVLRDAIAVRWCMPPNPRPREDTAERAKGLHNDPTAAVALDERRLSVGGLVLRSERLLTDKVRALRGVRVGLERALADWEGEADK